MLRRCALVCTIVVGSACGVESTSAPVDEPDSGLPPGIYDTDRDGLCDDSELVRSTDLNDPDTDGDGFPDGFEVGAGFDPRAASSPSTDEYVVILEATSSSAAISASFNVSAEGMDVSGGIQSEDFELVEDALGRYVQGLAAVAAYPQSNVALIEEDAGRFRQVVGRTRLTIEARFRSPEDNIESCTRLLPFRMIVKTNDGNIQGRIERALVITPRNGDPLDPSTWCPPPGVCY